MARAANGTANGEKIPKTRPAAMTFRSVKLKMGRAGAGLARGKGEKNSEESPRCRETSMSGCGATVGLGGKGEKSPKSRPAAMKLASFCLTISI